MILSMSGQGLLFLTTVAAGFVIGFVYDIFRIVRKTVPHSHLMVQAEDLLYWVAVSLMMFYFMLHRNYGEIRIFSIAGAALGMILYFYSVSVIVMKVSVAVIGFIQKVILTAVRILLTPVRWLVKMLVPPCKWLLRWIHMQISGKTRHVKKRTAIKLQGLRRSIFRILKADHSHYKNRS